MKQKKNENTIRDLARTLASARYHYTTFSSNVERVLDGKNHSFPCVMIEQSLAIGYPSEELAQKESKNIARLVKKSGLPVLQASPIMQQRIEIMSSTDTSVNQLIGAIKVEIMAIDEKAANKSRMS